MSSKFLLSFVQFTQELNQKLALVNWCYHLISAIRPLWHTEENFFFPRMTEPCITKWCVQANLCALNNACYTSLFEILQKNNSLFLSFHKSTFSAIHFISPTYNFHETYIISSLNTCRIVSSFPRLHFQTKFPNVFLKVRTSHPVLPLISLWLTSLACRT